MVSILNTGTAFVLGAMHALEPGHGKTAMASYTVGNINAKNHLFTLVFSMAFSHTFMLLAIGFVVSYLFPLFDSEKAEHILGIMSPLFLISIGGYMLYKIKNNTIMLHRIKLRIKANCILIIDIVYLRMHYHGIINIFGKT